MPRTSQPRRWYLILLCLISGEALRAGTFGRIDLDTLKTPTYTVEGDGMVRHNGDRFSNRPLYCNHTFAIVLAGDKPYLFFGNGPTASGSLMFALMRNGTAKWLFDASDITSIYRPDRMEWIIKDSAWGDTAFDLEVVPAAEGAGMAVRLKATGSQAGDQILWASGGATHLKESILYRYDMTTVGRENQLHRGFVPDDCSGDKVAAKGNYWTLQPASGKKDFITAGQCSEESIATVVDAQSWTDPATLLSHPAAKSPLVAGIVALKNDAELFWSMHADADESALPVLKPADDFAAGMARAKAVQNQVVVDTPDPWLNAGVGASCAVMDGVYRDGMYTHSGMRWGTPLLGWRTTFGATAYGWHDNVKTEAKRCIAKQITESDKTTPEANPAALLSSQSGNSRMFGKGRVNLYQPAHYDMQSQFFDQLVSAWRWTADPELEAILRPAMDLHLEYIKDCFDPADLGIYESYANTWPTDDQWYNGGGTSEETAYAYNGHRAAFRMAERAGDQKQMAFHQAAMDKIRKGFFDLLWNPVVGHPGAYREQGGHNRLHDDCWLYSIFCPIDAGLLSTEQAAQSLQYTETSLERITMPYGGEQCWPSNWVPSIWSLREMWPGDNYQLALAYFQTGLADDGWKVLHGTFPLMMFFGPVPGDLGYPNGGTDFNDCASMFCRTVVEGLFGIRPDYPDGKVVIAPQFPTGWDHAAIKTPDVECRYSGHQLTTTYGVNLTNPADIEFQLPVSTTAISSLTLNNAPAKYELMPVLGRTLVKVIAPKTKSATIQITTADTLPSPPSIQITAQTGDTISLPPGGGQAIDFHDPEGVFQHAGITKGEVTGTISNNVGDHEVFVLTAMGQTTRYRIFKVRTQDTVADIVAESQIVTEVPKDTRFAPVDLSKQMNADVREIFQQKYLSPRPNTCSLRLATDGYSTWQMILDKKNKTPDIDFSNVQTMMDGKANLVTPKGVPFAWSGGKKNIAFTSQWDNFPRQITVPVDQTGQAIWLLVCGSTNPMECGIANAEIRMNYADGSIDPIELIPPMNFWSLCPFGRVDYNYQRDGFCLPKVPPETIQLGNNCRAIVLNRRLKAGVALKSITLETLSEQVVIGLMGATMMNPGTGK
jgi:hypothetical protein